MPGKLQQLINRINMSGEERITGIITDWTMGWSLEVAEKMNIHRAIFWPASAAILCSMLSISKLVNDGIIDIDGEALHYRTRKSSWHQKCQWWTLQILHGLETVIVSNSAYDLEPGAFSFTPNILPVGPLLASNRLGDQVGYFWAEDSTCLKWLEKQPPNSVVYIAFGSFTVFDQAQFQELALRLVGLKLDKDRGGIITGEEIKNKVERVVGDEKFKARALELRRLAMQHVEEGGCSSRNFKNFVEWMKA
ncbi:hypothetical protein OIU74_027853 [Salix koriyanagi]|uniref:Uncharacterized protein n=1 Tax=Salix koriyanagi TaxID=2511006 RepID=A0A9Q0VQE8_9ROSI|nr:hypothetical protein OIU74_027853 [Salix koriyanagi]